MHARTFPTRLLCGLLVVMTPWTAQAEPAASAVVEPAPHEAPPAPAQADDTATPADAPTDAAVAPAEDEAAPEEPVSPSLQRAEALFQQANAAYELGQYGKAASLFQEAWELEPMPELLYNLGQAHWRWFDIDPKIDHLRKARSFFQNYDKRMQGREDYFPSEVHAFVTALNTQISAEEQKQAERERPVIVGPSVDELEAAERRRLRREQNLMVAKRLNASGIAMIVAGAVAAAVGVGGVIARTANKLILDNTSGLDDPNLPSPISAREDERRRDAYLVGGQVAYGGFVTSAIFLPIGIGLRVTGAVMERRELGKRDRSGKGLERQNTPPAKPVEAYWRPGSLLMIQF